MSNGAHIIVWRRELSNCISGRVPIDSTYQTYLIIKFPLEGGRLVWQLNQK